MRGVWFLHAAAIYGPGSGRGRLFLIGKGSGPVVTVSWVCSYYLSSTIVEVTGRQPGLTR